MKDYYENGIIKKETIKIKENKTGTKKTYDEKGNLIETKKLVDGEWK